MKSVSAISLCALLASAGGAAAQDLIIGNTDEFMSFVFEVNSGNAYESKTIVLDADIDLSGQEFDPIGTGNGFSGHFDGKGHMISGFTMSSAQASVGLFGQMTGHGSIKNLILDDTCSITGTFSTLNQQSYIGGILGSFSAGQEEFYIESCINMAKVSYTGNVGKYTNSVVRLGGIVGSLTASSYNNHILNCVNEGVVSFTGTAYYPNVGGIVGYINSIKSASEFSTVSRCANYGIVKKGEPVVYQSDVKVGGIVGSGVDGVVIEKSMNYGTVALEGTSNSYYYALVGGIIGEGYFSSGSTSVIIKNCDNYGDVSDSSNSRSGELGGIAGRCQSSSTTYPCTINNCMNRGYLVHNGTVSYSIGLGGVVGYPWKYTSIDNCVNFGNLYEDGNKGTQCGYSGLGGIVGFGQSTTVKNSVNYGDIDFNGNSVYAEVGGIFGRMDGDDGGTNTAANCMNYGSFSQRGTTSSFYSGGIAGFSNGGVMDNCVGAGEFTYTLSSAKIGGILGACQKGTLTNNYWRDNVEKEVGYGASGATQSGSYKYTFTSGSTLDIIVDGISIITRLNNVAISRGYSTWVQNPGEYKVTIVINGKIFISGTQHIFLLPSFVESTGDSFSGWYNDKLISSSATITTITGETNIYSSYGKLHKIKFTYGDPPTTVESIQAEGETLVYPDYFLSGGEGEEFKWCNDDESVCSPTTVTGGDIEVTGGLVAKSYVATFVNEYNRSESFTIDIKYGTTIQYPTLTRTGYTLSGWVTEPPITGDTMPSVNVKFTPQWVAIDYVITFNTGFEEIIIPAGQAHYGDAVTYPAPPSRAGYSFDKWVPSVEITDGKMPPSNVTFTAVWIHIEYTITFNTGFEDIVIPVGKAYYEDAIPYPDPPSRTGYTFVKWVSSVEITGSSMPASDVTFTAEWIHIQYTITFNTGFADIVIPVGQAHYEDAIPYPEPPKRAGYSFDKWVPDVEITGTSMPPSDVTFTAVWIHVEYTITFNTGFEDLIIPLGKAYYEDAIPYPDPPSRIGYTFVKWVSSVEITGDVMPDSDITFTAEWIHIQYTITFNTGVEGITVPVGQSYYEDAIPYPELPKRAGYTLGQWVPSVELVDGKMPPSDVTFTAVWIHVEYTITFNTGFEDLIIPAGQAYYEDIISYPAPPTRTGYTFDNWVPNVEIVDGKMPDSNVTFTAVWIHIQYTITFNTGVEGITVPVGQSYYEDAIPYPELPKRAGYTLAGWVPDVELVDGKMPASDVTFTAEWSHTNYTVSFDTGDDEVVVPDDQAHYEDDIPYPEPPRRDGYTFDNWVPDVEIVDDKMPDSNVTFTAEWTRNQYTITFLVEYGDEVKISTVQAYYEDDIPYPTPVREGYVLDGWEPDVEVSDDKVPASNVTFTAVWVFAPEETSEPKEPTNAVEITFGKGDMSKEDMLKKIDDLIDAEEGTYEVVDVTPEGSDEPRFIVLFKDVDDASKLIKKIEDGSDKDISAAYSRTGEEGQYGDFASSTLVSVMTLFFTLVFLH